MLRLTAITKRGLRAAALLCGLAIATTAAHGDRERLSFSTVEWSAPAQSLDVTHRIHLHDAQQALVRAGLLTEPDLVPLINRARLALYVGQQFRIAGEKSDIDLDTLGAEIEGNYVYIYQQAEMDAAPDALYVQCNILRTVFSDQSNHVNVKLSETVQTLTFAPGDGIKSAR